MLKRLILLCLLVIGCTSMHTKFDGYRSDNRMNLLKLSRGMSKAEALDVMGVSVDTLTSRNRRDGGAPLNPVKRILSNPHRSAMYEGGQGESIEVLYYYTDLKAQDGAITDDELTPIVFVDGELSGWGWDYWQSAVQKYEIRVR